MDKRDSSLYKNFNPAAEPVVRSRQRSASAAQAAAGDAPGRPGSEAQASAMRRRSVDRASLAAPVVFEPRRRELRTPTVKPVTFTDRVVGKIFRKNWIFFLLSILAGIASGVFLLMLNEKNGLLSVMGAESMDPTKLVLYCVGWGIALGLLYGFLITRFYRNLRSALPVYATLLYMPVLLFVLLPLLSKFTMIIFAVLALLLQLAGMGFAAFMTWSYFCGG